MKEWTGSKDEIEVEEENVEKFKKESWHFHCDQCGRIAELLKEEKC